MDALISWKSRLANSKTGRIAAIKRTKHENRYNNAQYKDGDATQDG